MSKSREQHTKQTSKKQARDQSLCMYFDIDKVEAKYRTAFYGMAAWNVFLDHVDVTSLKGRCSISSGDVASPVGFVYCIRLDALDDAACVRLKAMVARHAARLRTCGVVNVTLSDIRSVAHYPLIPHLLVEDGRVSVYDDEDGNVLVADWFGDHGIPLRKIEASAAA